MAVPSLLIRCHVADYPTWKAVFDEHELTRRANGSRGGGSSATPTTRMRFCFCSHGTASSGHDCSPTPTICARR